MPTEADDFLAHYGVQGMKWGRRRGKSVTGVSRTGGALMDRNARMSSKLNAAKAGNFDIDQAIGSLVVGKKRWEKMADTTLANMKSQDDRIKSGKMNLADKMDAYNTVTLFDLYVSYRPKD